MAIEWHSVHGSLEFGIDWNWTADSTKLTIAPKIYRWDRQSTDNYSGKWNEYLSPDPVGAGAWYNIGFGSGSGTRQIDYFDPRTFKRTHNAQTITYTMSWNSSTGTWDGSWIDVGSGSKSWTLTVDALASYAVTYDANSGSGAPTGQTKWYGENLTLQSGKPTRTGYTFQGWATSQANANAGTVAYAPGATYTGNAALTLFAVWRINTWTVTYNANGGSGAPNAQTKTYGQALTLSSTIPTRNLKDFVGWGTSATATTKSYDAGGSYTKDENITLYAIWKDSYIPPTCTISSAYRSNSSGVGQDDGTYAKVSFTASVNTSVNGASNVIQQIQYRVNGGSWVTVSSVPSNATTYSGDIIISDVSTDSQYDIQVSATDKYGNDHSFPNKTTIASTYISMAFITMDFLAGGHGIAFGQPSKTEGFNCGMNATFGGTVKFSDNSAITDYRKLSDGTFSSSIVSGSAGNTSEHTVGARAAAGHIYLFSQGSSTGSMGVYSTNASGTSSGVVTLDQSRNLYLKGELLSDFVIAQGTSGDWRYRKWLSGVYECWFNVTFNASINNSWGQGNLGNNNVSPRNYPITFVGSRPTVTVGVYTESGYSVAPILEGGSTSQSPRVNCFRPAGQYLDSSFTYNATLHVIGRWK